MKSNKKFGFLILAAVLLIAVPAWVDSLQPKDDKPALSEAVFHVSWYDVGEAVLEGLKGVELVNSGFDRDRFTETNTVWYDPAIISRGEMQQALKNAGTYLETAE
jgi:hypothetical protein